MVFTGIIICVRKGLRRKKIAKTFASVSVRAMALLLAATTSASALIAGMRAAPLVMQAGPTEQEGAWCFRHGPGVIADQGAAGWAVAGGPGEYVGKVMPSRGHGMHHLAVQPENGPMRTRLPGAAANPAIAASNPSAIAASTSSAMTEEAAKAAWLAGARGAVAHDLPAHAVPYNYAAGPTEKETVWSFRHGPGQLQPLSSGGP